MATLDPSNVSPGYRGLVEAVGVVDLTGRTQLEFTGDDLRQTFLHNFCTNSIRDLPIGRGAEAFVLDAKGHILGHVLAFCAPRLIVPTPWPGKASAFRSISIATSSARR